MILYNLIVALVALPSHIHINAFSVSDVYLSSLTTTSINDYNLAIDTPVYVGDITTSNVRNLLMSLTQAYPPVGDAKHLLDRAGDHWSKVDSSKRLPIGGSVGG